MFVKLRDLSPREKMLVVSSVMGIGNTLLASWIIKQQDKKIKKQDKKIKKLAEVSHMVADVLEVCAPYLPDDNDMSPEVAEKINFAMMAIMYDDKPPKDA